MTRNRCPTERHTIISRLHQHTTRRALVLPPALPPVFS